VQTARFKKYLFITLQGYLWNLTHPHNPVNMAMSMQFNHACDGA